MTNLYRIALAALLGGIATPALSQELPPADAKAGECYAKVLVPARYETTAEQVMVQPGQSKFEKVPAVYKDVEKRILIAEESYVLEPVPPVFETVTERVLIQPEEVRKSVVPATYRTETKRVLVSPARVEWKVGRGAYEKIDTATGEIMCRVEIPAVYKDVEQQVLNAAAQTREEVIPARYETIERRVMKTPPTTRKKVVPAEYRTVIVRELVTPERFQVQETPPRFETIEKRKLASPESVQWRQILCETNTTPQVVLQLQRALQSAGFDLGFQPDGEYGPATAAVVRRYQDANNLPTGGLTLDTLRRLGVSVTSS